jgi:hypothetical protein
MASVHEIVLLMITLLKNVSMGESGVTDKKIGGGAQLRGRKPGTAYRAGKSR